MKRATVTIPDDLEAEIEAYNESLETPPSLATLLQAALRYYLREKVLLERRQYRPPERPLRIARLAKGSGVSDISEQHDKYLED